MQYLKASTCLGALFSYPQKWDGVRMDIDGPGIRVQDYDANRIPHFITISRNQSVMQPIDRGSCRSHVCKLKMLCARYVTLNLHHSLVRDIFPASPCKVWIPVGFLGSTRFCSYGTFPLRDARLPVTTHYQFVARCRISMYSGEKDPESLREISSYELCERIPENRDLCEC